jgi:hypothetical protein
MEISAEVTAFDGKVCGDQYFGVLWRAENGAVVTDS